MKKLGTITDRQGRTTEITTENADSLAFIYFDRYDDLQADVDSCLNYSGQEYLGHDNDDSYGPRFVFDGSKRPIHNFVPHDKIVAILPVKEFQKKMLEMFG